MGNPWLVHGFFCGRGVPVGALARLAAYSQQTAASMKLPVPFESQLDNASGTGYRECFSSSCAMLAKFWGRIASDDAYNQIRARFGDTTSTGAQLSALRSLGLVAQFRTDGQRSDLAFNICRGRPVAVGWLHHGPVTAPTGSGHWSVVVGTWGRGWLMHDPNGEADLIRGGYLPNSNGAFRRYSWQNWEPRWLIESPRSGWFITAYPSDKAPSAASRR